jgi:hypothetical protein
MNKLQILCEICISSNPHKDVIFVTAEIQNTFHTQCVGTFMNYKYMDIHVKLQKTEIYKKSVINMGTAVYNNMCTTVYNNMCTTVYNSMCTTVYNSMCTTVYNNMCTTVYNNMCTTVYNNMCTTVYNSMCTTVYNNLPTFLKETDDYKAFRKELKLFLLLQSFCIFVLLYLMSYLYLLALHL